MRLRSPLRNPRRLIPASGADGDGAGCMDEWRRGVKERAMFCAAKPMRLLLFAGRHYNLERVIRSLMRTFTWRRSITIEMSIIGRHVHRLIVIALVIGLSVGTCWSPEALAELMGGVHGAVGAVAAATGRACPLSRAGHFASPQCRTAPRIAAELSDLEKDAHDRDGSEAAVSSVIVCPRTHLLLIRASQRVASTYSPTLHSLGICWRV